MRKYITNIAGVAVSLTVIYSVGWFYQANRIRTLTEELITDVSESVGAQRSEFFYSRSEVKGFPFRYDVNIYDPRFISYNTSDPIEISSADRLTVSTSTLGGSFRATFPEKINVSIKKETGALPYIISFNEAPVLDIKIHQEEIIPWVFKRFSEQGTDNLSATFKSLKYSDEGYVVVDGTTGEALASTKRVFIQLNTEDYTEGATVSELVFNIKNAQFDKLYHLDNGQRGLGNVNVSADISFIGPALLENISTSESNIRIRGIEFSSDHFGFNINGAVSTAKDDLFPFGDVRLKLTNFANLIDYKIAFINQKMSGLALPFFKIKTSQAGALKLFAEKIATEEHNDGKDLLMTFNRKQGESFFIGDKSLAQVMLLFRESFQQAAEQEETKPDPAPSAPTSVKPNLGMAPSLPEPETLPETEETPDTVSDVTATDAV